jgi:hypothetical protein
MHEDAWAQPTRPFLPCIMMSAHCFSLSLSAVLLSLGAIAGAEVHAPQVELLESSYHFEITGISEPVGHVFQFRNNTKETLEAAHINVTPPLAVPNISARVLPGELGMLRFSLGEPRPVGDYEGFIEVLFKNPGVSNITFEVTGKITPRIEVKPFPSFFVSTGRGHPKEASLRIINHDAQPLEINAIECPSARFSLRLATNQPGQVYTLFLRLAGAGISGRMAERITLHTSNPKEPELLIGASTFIHERVHTFPEDLDFGDMDKARVRTDINLRKTLTQVLMVYQDDGTNLQVTAKSDLPFLTTRAESAPAGNQVQVEVGINPEELPSGDFRGRLELLTNDREFPRLEISVRGHVR